MRTRRHPDYLETPAAASPSGSAAIDDSEELNRWIDAVATANDWEAFAEAVNGAA